MIIHDITDVKPWPRWPALAAVAPAGLAALDLPPPPWWLVAALAALLVVMVWAWRRAVRRTGRANRRRALVAQQAETEAERLLERLGYTLVDRQVTRRWPMRAGRREAEVWCRADLLATRRGRLYVADVKTGRAAPDPFQPATRRQLLEYLLAFDADGALVVDMERREVYEVAFPGLLGRSG